MATRPNPFINGVRVRATDINRHKATIDGVYILYRIERSRKRVKRVIVSVSHAVTGALQFVEMDETASPTTSYELCYVPFMTKLENHGEVVLSVKRNNGRYQVFSQGEKLPSWLRYKG